MKRLEITPQVALVFLVFALSFYSAWLFWTSVLYIEEGFFDILSGVIYGLVVVPVFIVLLAASLSTRYSKNVRLTMLLAGLLLLGMPFMFYYLSSPIFRAIVQVIEWIISLAICVVFFLSIRSQRLESGQRIAMTVAGVLALIAPFMPWFPLLFYSGRVFPANVLPWGLETYLGWAVIIIWAWAGILLTGKLGNAPTVEKFVPTLLKRVLVVGLGLFLLGILNPVPVGPSTTYEVKTYIAGQYTGSHLETLPDAMNFPLMGGAILLILVAVFSGGLRPRAKASR